MKILLMNCPKQFETQDYTTRAYFLSFMIYPPMGLLAIAADINPSHSVDILDTDVKNMSVDETEDYILKNNPDVLGISVVTRRLYSMHEITRRIKKKAPQIKIVAGGPHINYYPRETMELGFVDYALSGYGEKAFPLLIDVIDRGSREKDLRAIPNLYFRLENGEIAENIHLPPPSMDDLPFPKRSLLNLDDYYTVADKGKTTMFYSSRGCPFRCIFCDVQEKKWNYRSAKRVADEFEEILKMGIKSIHIFDDTFNVDRQRVIDICKEIIRRGLKIKWSTRGRVFPFDDEMVSLLKKSGCVRLHVGVETLDPEIMRSIKKGITIEQIKEFFRLCHKHKIETMAYFIVGFPGETAEYRKSFYKKIKELNPTYAYLNILCPLPKTEYYKNLLRDGVFKEDFWADFVRNPKKDFPIPYPRSVEEQKELERVADDFSRRFYFNPGFLLKELRRSIFYPRMVFFKIKGGLGMLWKIMR